MMILNSTNKLLKETMKTIHRTFHFFNFASLFNVTSKYLFLDFHIQDSKFCDLPIYELMLSGCLLCLCVCTNFSVCF